MERPRRHPHGPHRPHRPRSSRLLLLLVFLFSRKSHLQRHHRRPPAYAGRLRVRHLNRYILAFPITVPLFVTYSSCISFFFYVFLQFIIDVFIFYNHLVLYLYLSYIIIIIIYISIKLLNSNRYHLCLYLYILFLIIFLYIFIIFIYLIIFTENIQYLQILSSSTMSYLVLTLIFSKITSSCIISSPLNVTSLMMMMMIYYTQM